MNIQCQSPYTAYWRHSKERCPNILVTKEDRDVFGIKSNNYTTFPVTVSFNAQDEIRHWDSLVHLYNDYYTQYYYNVTFPRLIVRFEDMLLYPRSIINQINICVGTNQTIPPRKFRYETGKAKKHGSGTTFLQAILKSSNETRRLYQMNYIDIRYTMQHLDNGFFKSRMKYTMPNLTQIAEKEEEQQQQPTEDEHDNNEHSQGINETSNNIVQ